MEQQLKQSQNDHKIYQPLTLANGLKVLLIHNNETEKSAAALAVNVGHFNDPKDRQGLAHFLEHMLFLGTTEYPDGSEYQRFISQYGGCNNAWTATEHTCFFFDIHHHYFVEALDRFSQFFTSPLLSDEFVFSERQNIDAEFKLKLKDDIRRLYDVHKETINQAHPFSQFSVGDLDTLNDRENSCVRDEVEDFFNCHYRANYMTLALEGPQSIEELALLAEEKFSAIKSASQPQKKITEPLYLPENLAIKINVMPVRNDRKLIISFAMPSIDDLYRHKPESILSYLLGHEGKGSILSLLKQKQWAMALTAGSGVNGSNFKDFNISLTLTEIGEQHINEIINAVFSYIKLLKKSPLPQFYYQEKQAIADLSYRFHEKQSPLDSVSQLVINMQHYPVKDYIFGDYIMEGMDQNSINDLLSYLRTDNMRVIHVSQQAKNYCKNGFDHTSFWYQVPYSIEKLTATQLNKWENIGNNPALYLPSINPYITKNPKILSVERAQLIPILIDQSNGLKIWYKQDISFQVPKGNIYIGIDSPKAISSAENIAMTRLFVDLYSDDVIEDNYDAELAGIHYHLYAHQGGITLQLAGVSEKQPMLLTALLAKLTCHTTNQQRFTLLKKQLITHWQNSTTSKSISQLFSKLSSALQPNNPSSKVLAAALSNVTFEQYKIFAEKFFHKVTIDVLIHGNWHQHHANAISLSIKDAFNDQHNDRYLVKCPVIDIKSQGEIIMPLMIPDHDYAGIIYYPFNDKTVTIIACTMLLSQMLSPAFFQKMRTEKQYGYLVGVGYIPINRYPGIAFYIQSPDTDTFTLLDAMDEFIENSLTLISDINEQEWQQLKYGLASQLQEKDTSLRIKSQRFWLAICNKDANFDHKDALVEAILHLSLKEIKTFVTNHLVKSHNRDRISLISLKNEQEISNKEHLTSKIKYVADFAKINLRKY